MPLIMFVSSSFNTYVNLPKKKSDMESESHISNCEGMPPLEDCDGDELALPVRESLVIRRTLQV